MEIYPRDFKRFMVPVVPNLELASASARYPAYPRLSLPR